MTALVCSLTSARAFAQAPPSPTPDAPRVVLGAEIFTNLTWTLEPKTLNDAGQVVTLSAFDLPRASVDVAAALSRRVSLRLISDVTRNTDSASSQYGTLVMRVRQAYGAVALGGGTDTWIRLGAQPTPYVEYDEAVYRYRFQGTTFTERVGALAPEDVGVSFHTLLPGGHGDVHAGIYNGEGVNGVETDSHKAADVRASVQPLPRALSRIGRVTVTGFYDADWYVADGPRSRAVAAATIEQRRFNAGVEYLRQTDKPTPQAVQRNRRGWSAWATPFFHRKGDGLEALLRYDVFTPRLDQPETEHRAIAGVAYWFPHTGSSAMALLADFDQLTFVGAPAGPASARQRQVGLHALVRF